MPWRRLVVRPDSIIRYWSFGFLDVVTGYSSVYDSPHIRSINFDSYLGFSDGAAHVRGEELMSLAQGLIQASKEYPRLFLEIGEHYERLGREWLEWIQSVAGSDLGSKTGDELAALLQRFVSYFADYSPILYVPFVVERRYAAEYPQLIDRLAQVLSEKAREMLGSDPTLQLLSKAGAVQLPEDHRDLRDSIRGLVEHSVKRTMAEEKEIRLLEIATKIEANPGLAEMFSGDTAPTAGELEGKTSEVYAELQRALSEFGWIKQWGYPPRYSASTMSDFLEDVQGKFRQGATNRLQRILSKEVQGQEDYRSLLEFAGLSAEDEQLLDDVNYYNFLRTFRMEVQIKAQYFSVPLLREIERRGIERGVMQRDDIFYLVPPEIVEFLAGGPVPKSLADRRQHWAMPTHAREKKWHIITGKEYDEFTESFFSVIDFRENARGLHSNTAPFVGGKGAGLFRLVELGYNTPPFFVVTTEAFKTYIRSANLHNRLSSAFDELESESGSEKVLSAELQAIIQSGTLPESLHGAIHSIYKELGLGKVAVRSSATAEDSVQHSWAGRFESLLDVTEDRLDEAIKQIWASLFAVPALHYAREVGVDLVETPMAVVVQSMVPSEVSGVMNTSFDPSTPEIVEIEVAWGYGAPLVSGEITPDRYLVRVGDSAEVLERTTGQQSRMLSEDGWLEVDSGRAKEAKLADELLLDIARAGKELESDLGSPQDVEFTIAGGKLILLQSRPQTALEGPPTAVTNQEAGLLPSGARLVASGLKGKTARVIRGTAQVLTSMDQGKQFRDGNILVVHAATPAWDPIAFRASALVTNEGGATSHAIRVANERGFPAVVGTINATETIKDNSEVVIDTVSDPFRGRVYEL